MAGLVPWTSTGFDHVAGEPCAVDDEVQPAATVRASTMTQHALLMPAPYCDATHAGPGG